MPNTVIQLKKSATAAAIPSTLEFGELAINYADGKLYYKNTNSNIVEFTPGGGNNFGTVNANGTLIVSDTSGDVLTLVPGNNITIVGDAVNDKVTISLDSSILDAVGTNANSYAVTVGTGANNFLLAVIAGANTAVGTGANAFTSATIAGANTAVGTGANAFTSATIAGANTAVGSGANNFLLAVIAGANTAVGAGANNYQIAIQNGANTAVGSGANAFASATIAGANTAVGTGANAFTSATIAGANTAVGTGANNFLLAVIAGANTAVGAGANAYATAAAAGANNYQIAIQNGANTAVGAGANAFTSATISGANTAVGAGANAFTSATISGANTAVGTGANNYLLTTLAGANTAVGAGANAFTSATIAGANTAVGTGANNFLLAVIAGANTAVGAGANSVAIAAFEKANLGGGTSVAVSDVAPPTPTANSLWWSSALGKMFIYYNDGSSSQWVETTSRSIDQLSSNITVNTITTYNETSSLVIRTGNANNGIIKVEGANNEIFISKIPIVITNNATRLDIAGEFGDYTTSFNSYAQLHMRNASSGPNASGDLVITNDTGTDTRNFIDLGINGSGYADPAYNVVTGGDGYLFTSNGNLAIGTANTSVKEIRFHTGGSQDQNERIVIAQGVTIGYSGLGDPGANNMNVIGDVRARSFSGFGTGFANMNVVNTLGYQIWNIPTGVKRWKVTVCGGGGSGGGTHGVAGAIGHGAGSGGVSVIYFDYVDGVNTMAMNVGLAAGFAVVTTNANGVTGFPSNVNYNNTWAFGNGGIGGANSWFGGNTSAIGVGGAASGGVLNLRGANGEIGGIASATNPLFGRGGATPLGLCTGGEMAIGSTAAGANGTNAASFGGGGGGGKNASSTTLRRGGSGANGVIIIEW